LFKEAETFKCGFCHNSYSSLSVLRFHLRQVHQTICCSVCYEACKPTDIDQHMKSKHQTRSHPQLKITPHRLQVVNPFQQVPVERAQVSSSSGNNNNLSKTSSGRKFIHFNLLSEN
jgi:hypothetical protein